MILPIKELSANAKTKKEELDRIMVLCT
jgi:hypothetical protein